MIIKRDIFFPQENESNKSVQQRGWSILGDKKYFFSLAFHLLLAYTHREVTVSRETQAPPTN